MPRSELDRAEELQCQTRVGLGVEGQRRLVPGEAVLVGELRILFLQMAAVGKKELAQGRGRPRGKDGPVPTQARHAR
jgi:hypothetical protein